MAHISRRDVLTAGSALALATLGTREVFAREITPRQKELYELAKKEGEVTWYTAHSNDTTAQALGRDFEAGLSGHQGERRAHHRAGRLSARHPGAARRRHAGRRALLDRHRPLRVPEGEEPARAIRAGQCQQGDRRLQGLRSGRLLHRHLRRPDRDRLQYREAEGGRRAEELARPHRSEMEGQDRARASRASPAMSAPGW